MISVRFTTATGRKEKKLESRDKVVIPGVTGL